MSDAIKYCPWCAGLLGPKHAEGRVRLVCTACGRIFYRNPLPAATALVLDPDGRLMLGRRSVEPARGEWCLPGGFVELDETMEEAALRELQEETGISGSVLSFVGCYYQRSSMYGGVIIFGYRVAPDSLQVHAGDDMQEIGFFDLDSLPAVAFESHRKLIEVLKKEVTE